MTDVLARLLRDCDVESLAALYYSLREGIEDPEVRETTDEVVRASLRRISRVLEAIGSMLEASHGSAG